MSALVLHGSTSADIPHHRSGHKLEEKVLEGKKALVFGVANRRSIAWGIAQALAGAGARLALTYQEDRVKETVNELAASIDGTITLPCDVMNDEQVDETFARVDEHFDGLDILVHSIAFAPREALEGL